MPLWHGRVINAGPLLRHWRGTCGPKFTFHIHVKPRKEEPYGTTLFARSLQGCARGHAQAQKRYAEERQKRQDRQEPQAGHRYRPRRGAQERQEGTKTSIGAVVTRPRRAPWLASLHGAPAWRPVHASLVPLCTAGFARVQKLLQRPCHPPEGKVETGHSPNKASQGRQAPRPWRGMDCGAGRAGASILRLFAHTGDASLP